MVNGILGACNADNQLSVAGDERGKVIGLVVGNDLTVVDNENTLADGGNLLQNVGGKNDGSVLAQILDNVSYLDDLLGVETDGGLVKDKYFGVADQSLSQTDTLLITFGKVADKALIVILEADQLADFCHVGLSLEFLYALKIVNKVKVLFYRHIQVERGLLGQIANVLLGSHRVFQNVDAADTRRTGVRGKITRDNVHRG